MARKKPNPDQREIDFGRAAQINAIGDLLLPAKLVGLGRPVSAATVISILRVIDNHQGKKERAWPKISTIAQGARVSTRTVQRAMDCLEALNLLTVWEERSEYGFTKLYMAINWQRIFAERLPAKIVADNLRRRRRERSPQQHARPPVAAVRSESAAERLPATEVDRSESESERPPEPQQSRPFAPVYTGPKRRQRDRRQLMEPGDTGAQPGDTGAQPGDTGSATLLMNRPLNRPLEPSSPSPRNLRRVDRPAPQQATWSEVEEELTQAGINSLACLQQARRYVSPEHVLELIRWWSERRETWQPDHQPGVLYVRIQRAREYLAVADGWRDPHPERLARWKRLQQTPEPLPAALPVPRESSESRAGLETRYGASLDALSTLELAELAASLSPYLQAAVRQRGRESRAVRGALLMAISKAGQVDHHGGTEG